MTGGLERGRVAGITTDGVLVTLDRFTSSYPAGPLLIPPRLAATVLAVGDRVIVACLGGSIDDLMLAEVLD